jgi:hypothetical protein
VQQQMLQDAYWCLSVPVVMIDQGTQEISKEKIRGRQQLNGTYLKLGPCTPMQGPASQP